jgi:hypothetical protein
MPSMADFQFYLLTQVRRAITFGYPVALVRLEWDAARGKKIMVTPPPRPCVCGTCPRGRVKCSPMWHQIAPPSDEQLIEGIRGGMNAFLIRTAEIGVAVRDADTPEVRDALLALLPRHVVRTPRGGIHAYYRGPRVRSERSGEDTMMTQVYGPGSFYERDGQIVTYVGEVPNPSELDPLPAQLAVEAQASRARARIEARQLKPRSVAAREFDRLRDQLIAAVADGRRGLWSYDAMRDLAAHLVRLCGADIALRVWDEAFAIVGVNQDDDDRKHIESACEKFDASRDDVRPDEQVPAEVRFLWGGLPDPEPAPAGPPAAEGTATGGHASVTTNLPAEFWESRDSLKRIRQSAHAAYRSADAVLGVVLARLSSMLPATVRVDTGVGVPASLNMFSVLLGTSSTGKSTAARLADSLFHLEPGTDELASLVPLDESTLFVRSTPVGSGEGIADEFMGMLDDIDPRTGRVVKRRAQVRDRAMFSADEGAQLLESASRQGSTLLPVLRQSWTGAPFGMRNATTERDRYVRDYAMGLWIGMQPSHAARLLSEQSVDEGTLQRFVWFSATDPAIDYDPVGGPSPLHFDPQVLNETVMGDRIEFPASISRELQIETVRINRGELSRPVGREHEPLQRVKLSGLLAILDGRTSIDLADWALAGAVLDTSAAVVSSVRQHAAQRASVTERSIVEKQHRRAELAATLAGARAAKLEATVQQRLVSLVAQSPFQKPGFYRRRLRSDERPVFDELLPDMLAAGELGRTDVGLHIP